MVVASGPIRWGETISPYGPGVGRTVSMAADMGIDRTVVHASAAADAPGLAQFLIGEGLGSPIVEEHQMDFLRTVQFSAAGPEIMLKW